MLLWWNIIFLTQILFLQIKWKLTNTKNTQLKIINIKNTLCDTHRTCALFGQIQWRSTRREWSIGQELLLWVLARHLRAQWWRVSPRGHTPFFPCDRRCKHGFHLGKGDATWEHGQVVDLCSLGIMCAPEKLDEPIYKPMESHDNWHKEERRQMTRTKILGVLVQKMR